jgi:hypothetical protein
MESDVCETLISVPNEHELQAPTLCVYFCQRTEYYTVLVYGQQSGDKTTVYLCVYKLYKKVKQSCYRPELA